MAIKYAAFGMILARTTAPAATIAGVKSIEGPDLKLEVAAVTTPDSTGAWAELTPGTRMGMSIS